MSSEFSRLTPKFFPPFLASCSSTPQSGVAPSDIGDIVMGSVLGSGSQRANECRIAMFYAGFPEEVPVRVVNRQCSSGLQAIADVVASIRCAPRLPSPPLHTSRSRADLVSPLHSHSPVERTKRSGFYDIGIAGGIETMSSNPMAWDGSINPRISDFEKAQGCLLPMGITSENVAKKYGITRLEQDKFAVESHAR